MAVSATHNGFRFDRENTRLDLYYRGTRVAHINSTGLTTASGQALTVTDTGLTVTAGNVVATAGDVRITAADLRLGPVNAFASTEPTQAMVFEAGTAPAGAITPSGGIFTDGTTVKKIIADGTVSDVQTCGMSMARKSNEPEINTPRRNKNK